MKAYNNTLLYANILHQPPVVQLELEDEPGSNLDDLEGYRLVLDSGGRATESDQPITYNHGLVIEE